MASKYKVITKEEFDSFVVDQLGFVQKQISNANEYIYIRKLSNDLPNIYYIIFSSISIHNNGARKKGGDAIRLGIINHTPTNKKLKFVSVSKKIYRVMGWKNNLQTKLDEIKTIIRETACEICGSYMIKRTSVYGIFYGCSAYPDCKNTVQFHKYKQKIPIQAKRRIKNMQLRRKRS